MGYYEQRPPSDEERGAGCLEALIITRAVFAVLIWPMLAIFAVIGFVAALWLSFTVHPALALIPVGLATGALWLFARWEQRRFRPPGL